jgi:DNA polymerase-3 subunit chi
VTTIDFYTHAADPLRLAARLAAKAWRTHGSVRILTPDAATTDVLDRLLWTEPQAAFVPHCRMASPVAGETPIWIDDALDHAGPAEVLVNLHREPPPFFSRFERLAEIVGAGDDALAAGRARYRYYRERGYELRQHDWSQRDG